MGDVDVQPTIKNNINLGISWATTFFLIEADLFRRQSVIFFLLPKLLLMRQRLTAPN